MIRRREPLRSPSTPDPDAGPDDPPYWVQEWDATYTELRIRELRTAAELSEVAYDVGQQLGAGHGKATAGKRESEVRAGQKRMLDELGEEIRGASREMVSRVLLGWSQFREKLPEEPNR